MNPNPVSDRHLGRKAEGVRRHNLGLVLGIIHKGDSVSRVQLAKMTGLAKPTVSDIVNELIGLGIVKESGDSKGSSKGGRRPIVLEHEKSSVLAVGVDIRRNQVSALLLNMQGEIVNRSVTDVDVKDNKDQILRTLHQTISIVLDPWTKKSVIAGIGVGVPGPLDLHKGIIMNPPHFRALENVNLKKQLNLWFKVPVFLELGAVAGAAGEYVRRGSHNTDESILVFLEIDTGIGLGIIANGRIVRGMSSAGAFGHMVVKAKGLQCHCGRRGCLIQYMSGLAVLKKLGLVESDSQNLIHSFNEKINYSGLLRKVIDGYREGDRRYLSAVDDAAGYLSLGIVNIFNLLSPHRFIVGSSIPGFAEVFLQPLMKAIARERTVEEGVAERIRSASYGSDAIAAGSATMVLNSFLKDPKGMLRRQEKSYA